MQIKYTNGIGWGSNMLKSSQEKLQRQAERDSKVAFFEAQKFRDDQQAVQDEILKNLRTMFDSDFIVSVGFSSVTCQ